MTNFRRARGKEKREKYIEEISKAKMAAEAPLWHLKTVDSELSSELLCSKALKWKNRNCERRSKHTHAHAHTRQELQTTHEKITDARAGGKHFGRKGPFSRTGK